MTENKKVMLAHGGGGRLMNELIGKLIVPRFANAALGQLKDSAELNIPAETLCFTTDSFVVKPLVFNGGDIGKLAVCGTINDLAVVGAKPAALSLSLIIEEGFDMGLLEALLDSAACTAQRAGVPIVTGDTKVVEKGAADGIYINTAGIGAKLDGAEVGFERICVGDQVIVTGTLGDHGMTIMSQREGLEFTSSLESDCAALNGLAELLFEKFGRDVKFMRDPTRGGLAAVANEIVQHVGLPMELDEAAIPIDRTVQAAADMLGLDVLNIANEGRIVALVAEDAAERFIAICRTHPLGRHAAIIGSVVSGTEPLVELKTKAGGRRVVQMPYGRELPRIC
ncbi:MAG TPA: hydrogenase expression/formation protein HypE [Phycisphaerales bacterium]|nr:hydrogenase expression/formation protein HypE [Phycisphaerales bacterium]